MCDVIKYLILFFKLWICFMRGDVFNDISMCVIGLV